LLVESKAYSFVGEMILDPFCGSGTTLRAATLESSNGVGYELNMEFLQYAKRQLEIENSQLI